MPAAGLSDRSIDRFPRLRATVSGAPGAPARLSRRPPLLGAAGGLRVGAVGGGADRDRGCGREDRGAEGGTGGSPLFGDPGDRAPPLARPGAAGRRAPDGTAGAPAAGRCRDPAAQQHRRCRGAGAAYRGCDRARRPLHRAPSGGDGASAAGGFAGVDRLSPDGGVWTGPLDALLDAWTGAAGYAWRHDADGIEIVRREARVFRIHALAGRQRYAASASTDDAASGGSEGGDGGGVTTSQSIAAETDYDPWPEIEAQAAVLAGPGAAVAAAPSSASLLVSRAPRGTWAACGPISPG